MISVWRNQVGIISDVVFVCERPEGHLKLFYTKIRQLGNIDFRSV